MAKPLLGISILLILGAAVLGFLNKGKLDGTINELSSTKDSLVSAQGKLTDAEKAKATAESAAKEADAKAEQAKSDLARKEQEAQALKNSADQLTAQIAEKQIKITELETQIAAAPSSAGTTVTPDADNTAELEAKLKELESQVGAAEEEKKILTEKVASAQSEADSLRKAEQNRVGGLMSAGLEGRIEAYNPTYNFVVLNIGDRQGVVANAEMIVTRGTTMVGKVKIASVYPTSAVADVVRASVPRGFQIQPGDRVVYQVQ